MRGGSVLLLGLALVLAGACAPASTSAASVAPTAAVTAAASTTPPSPTPSVASSPRPTATSSTVTVDMGDDFFTPEKITVAVGTTVVWENAGQEEHDVQARDRSFSSSPLGPGASFSYTFTKPGAYSYYCSFHVGDGMVGEVDVR
ncbi:MAG: cupredoxin domain-containing protein [Chloroflexota bacterium]|nr:cupredoxin domain-containing protein [Chloroflexota bacterium]MDE3100737.1 cupredoxin domain-containing protein [Chloroflexota bacterium]